MIPEMHSVASGEDISPDPGTVMHPDNSSVGSLFPKMGDEQNISLS
jgi:hypothetical protein